MFSTQQYFGFDPRTIPGCSLWFDGLDPNGNGTVPANNAALSTWVDKSGTGNSGTAIGTTPLYQSNSGVLFSTGGYSTSYSASLANESMFFVYTPTSVPDTITLAGPNDTGGRTITVNTSLRLESSSYFVGFGSVSPNSTVTLNQRCQSGYINTASSTVVVHNGTTYSAVSLSYTAGRTTRIGISGTNNAIPFKGTIHEVIAYNVALTASQRQQLEGYLAWKWGIQSSLLTGHPYKSSPNFQRLPSPLDFGPMLFWWDSADYGTFTPANPTAGTSITGWRDKVSGLTLSNSNASPTWQTDGVRFTNPSSTVSTSTQNLLYSNASSPYRLTQAYTIIVAHSPNLFTGLRNAVYISAPAAFNTNPSFWGTVGNGATEGSSVGAFNGAGSWLTLQQTTSVITTAGSRRIDSILSQPSSNFVWTNGTENTYGTNNINRGATVSGTAVLDYISMSTTSNISGNRAYDGTIHEVLVYSSNLSSNAIRQVEAYLAWKWNVRPNLVSTHPFFRIPTSSPLFVPSTLSNLGLWLDGADSSTITLSAGTSNVTEWRDKSGNSRHATGLTSKWTTYPTGANYVQFTAANNSVLSCPGMNVVVNTQYTFFTVYRRDNPPTNPNHPNIQFFCGGSDGTTNARLHIGYESSTLMKYAQWANQYSVTVPALTSPEPINVWGFMQTSNQRIMYLNGTIPSGGTNANSSLVSAQNGGVIGAYQSDPFYSLDGRLYEFVIFTRALSTTERQQMEGYLAWKYGAQTNLPTTHPYRRFRP